MHELILFRDSSLKFGIHNFASCLYDFDVFSLSSLDGSLDSILVQNRSKILVPNLSNSKNSSNVLNDPCFFFQDSICSIRCLEILYLK